MSTRKRMRSSLPADEEDELSPTKNPGEKDLLESNKKRKLNNYGSSSPTNQNGTLQKTSLLRRAANYLGIGKGRESAKLQEDGEEDELNADMDVDEEEEEVEDKEEEVDVWEVPEDDAVSIRRLRGRPKMAKKGVPKSTASRQTKAHVDSEELTPKRGRPKRMDGAAPKTTSGRKKDKEISPPAQRSAGRPRKSDILKKDKALSREAIRSRLSRTVDVEENDESEEASAAPIRRKSSWRPKSDAKDATHLEEETAQEETGSKPNGRSRPRNTGTIIGSPQGVPRGILTPSKGRTLKPRKSVLFKDHEELDLGFRDFPTSVNKKKPEKQAYIPDEEEGEMPSEDELTKQKTTSKKTIESTLPEEENDEDDSEDEIACAICLGLDSKKPNLMIFCDKCDFAVHQKCYGVPVIPNGDWFCKDCETHEDSLVVPASSEHLVTKVPAIDGFENHLQNIQRLLLDRLTGQERMKLHGHDEEMQKVLQVVEQTVLAGEGNSMLVIGARGCGKTTVGATSHQ